MIGRLEGQVLACSPGLVLLDVGGVGYEIQIPLGTFYRLARGVGERVAVFVHTHVRDDAITLFGFSSVEEKSAFLDLIAVSGVGPRMALAVLSGIDAAGLQRAIGQGDRGLLERIPGIGRKTAERILLELREAPRGRRRGGGAPHAVVAAPGGDASVRDDAISALMNLGYPADAAQRAVEAAVSAEGSGAALEAVLRAALRGLVR